RLAQTLLSYGRATLRDGDAAVAQQIFTEALDCWQHIGIRRGSIRSLLGLAIAFARQGQFAKARAKLRGATFDAAWHMGLTLPLDEAVYAALAAARQGGPTTTPGTGVSEASSVSVAAPTKWW